MKLQVVADVHGAHEALAKRLDPAWPIALLGDNVNLVDFHTLSGIAARVLTPEDLSEILTILGSEGQKKALAYANKVFFHNPERVAKARVEISKDYNELASILPEDAVVLSGNVDWPELLQNAMGARYIQHAVREIGGCRIGFVSGTGSYPYSINLPGEMSDDAYAEALFSIGAVDVLCTHFPPAIGEMTFDTIAKRDEGGGAMILDYLAQHRPRLHLFGHIHNPQVAEGEYMGVKLKNVGGFRYHPQVHLIDLERL